MSSFPKILKGDKMPEKDKFLIEKLKKDDECCPNCSNIEACRTYGRSGDKSNPEIYRWSEGCCEKCTDIICFQNPLYVMDLLRKERLKSGEDASKDYHNEALQTILIS